MIKHCTLMSLIYLNADSASFISECGLKKMLLDPIKELIAIFTGTRLYREPASKSNRSIILNAIEYVVFPGVVNAETRNRVLVRTLNI
jgi:Microtubule-binding calmodulin-regulated spectrin-associated